MHSLSWWNSIFIAWHLSLFVIWSFPTSSTTLSPKTKCGWDQSVPPHIILICLPPLALGPLLMLHSPHLWCPRSKHGAWHRVRLSGVFWMKKWMDGWMNECIICTLMIYVVKSYYILSSALRKSLWAQKPPPIAWRNWAHLPTTQPRSRHWMDPWGASWSRPSLPQVRASGYSCALRSNFVRLDQPSTSLTPATFFHQPP